MANNKNVIVMTDQEGEYEALYVDGNLISEASSLGEGDSFGFWGEMTQKYNFQMSDIQKFEVSNEDNSELMMCGSFPDTLSEFKTQYV